LLDEIKEKIVKIETISDETRKDVKEQISKMIDKNDENFKTLLKSSKEIDQNQLLTTLLPSLLQNPN
jgi:ATP-dependent Zn protease